jgi:iron complex outermembrane receptor protein
MRSQQRQLIWITSVLSFLIVSPVWASEIAAPENQQKTDRQAETNSATLSSEIASVNAIEQPAATVDEWLDQIAQTESITVTGVRLNRTDVGVEIILETAEGQLSEPLTSVVGNALIIELPNTVLTLPEGDEFQQASS